MNSIPIQITVIAAIILSIYLGSKRNKNTGMIAIALAYLIACFLMGKSSTEFTAYFPIRIMSLQIGVGFFYGFAIVNGTMDVLARKMIYPFRKKAKLVPFALFFCSASLTAIGADTLGTVLFMGALGMSLIGPTGMDPTLVCVAVIMGVPAGNTVPWASTGAMLRGYLDENFAPALAADYAARAAVAIFCTFTVVFTIMYFLFRGYRCNTFEMEKPPPFTGKQKKTFVLVALSILLLVVPQVIDQFFPNSICDFLCGSVHVYGLFYLFGMLATLMNLADEKEVFARIPWGVIMTLSGVMILIDLGTEAGMVDSFISLLSGNIPTWIVFGAVTLLGGLMSMFSNSLMVAGLLMPFITKLGATLGLADPAALLFAGVLGAYSSDIAPFSTGGALIMTQCSDEELKPVLFKRFFANVFIIMAIVIVLSMLGWFSLF